MEYFVYFGLDEDVMVWFGHSTYFFQINGKRILIDPVFSDYGAPVFFTNKAFDGTTIYSVDDTPTIDYLLITHDHYDHIDYNGVKDLESKTAKVNTGLGNGAH